MKKILLMLLICGSASAQSVTVQDGWSGFGNAPLLKVNSDGSLNISGSGSTSPAPLAVTTTDKSGTVTLGGTAQAAIALNASRKAYCVQNPPTATEVLTVRVNGTASATTGVILSAGSQACSLPGLIDTAAVSVFAATTAHAFTAWEAQ